MVRDVLVDAKWHAFAEILKEVGDKIMPERAVRFYMGTGSGAQEGATELRPIDEQIRCGRRRGVYQALERMLGTKLIECKNLAEKVDDREYKISTVAPAGKPAKKPTPAKKEPEAEKKKEPEAERRKIKLKAKYSGADGCDSFVEELLDLFDSNFPGSPDRADFEFHCRALKRIYFCNFATIIEKMSTKAEESVPDATAPQAKGHSVTEPAIQES